MLTVRLIVGAAHYVGKCFSSQVQSPWSGADPGALLLGPPTCHLPPQNVPNA